MHINPIPPSREMTSLCFLRMRSGLCAVVHIVIPQETFAPLSAVGPTQGRDVHLLDSGSCLARAFPERFQNVLDLLLVDTSGVFSCVESSVTFD